MEKISVKAVIAINVIKIIKPNGGLSLAPKNSTKPSSKQLGHIHDKVLISRLLRENSIIVTEIQASISNVTVFH